MASKFTILCFATSALAQAFAGAGSAPGLGVAPGANGQSIALPPPQTILPVILLDLDRQPLVGSVLSAPNAQTTVLALACPPGVPAEACGLPPQGYTLEHISSSIFRASVTLSEAGKTATLSWGCTITSVASLPAPAKTLPAGMGQPSANAAICATSAGGQGISNGGQTTLTVPASALPALLQGVGITAGADKLAVTAGAANSTSAASGTSSTVAGAAGGAATTASSAMSSMSSSASSAAASLTSSASAAMSSATKAAANATASAAGSSGAAVSMGLSGFSLSLVSAAVFGSLLYAL